MALERQDVAGAIRAWLREHVTGDIEIHDHDQLIASGLLTSLQTVELVLFLDEHFGIEVTDDEFIEENFASVDTMAQLVLSKRG
jgi:acyl carrier protein